MYPKLREPDSFGPIWSFYVFEIVFTFKNYKTVWLCCSIKNNLSVFWAFKILIFILWSICKNVLHVKQKVKSKLAHINVRIEGQGRRTETRCQTSVRLKVHFDNFLASLSNSVNRPLQRMWPGFPHTHFLLWVT